MLFKEGVFGQSMNVAALFWITAWIETYHGFLKKMSGEAVSLKLEDGSV
jgi:hypothetical protein